jgi:hypothetical protein
MDDELTPLWEHARHRQRIREIKILSAELAKLGREYHLADISAYAGRLQDGLVCFDVDKIQKTLAWYPALLSRLKADGPAEDPS